ncbi:MAG: cation:proton antiporter [Candidatus Bathyarchaeota archaeon]|nr:cation:proton antiporter [Candidatus Bathyarchaeota archaeon]MDH5732700.1 cation:proton antiporter [Candidatus Bathyarchaeota archaeon]
MEDIMLLIVITYSVSLGFGYLLQKYLRIPWMFASLFFGLILSTLGLFKPAIESDLFKMLETLGMYLLLFIIGFELDFKRIGRLKNYVFLGTLVIIAFEGFFGSLLLYFVFPAEVSHSYLIAVITALSFATVGEAVLLPILNEFGVIQTTFGQLTLGIGTLDDVIEVLMLAVVAILPGFLPATQTQSFPDPLMILLDLGCLLLLTFTLIKLGGKIKRILEKNHPAPYVTSLLTLLVFFSFVALGGFVFESLATVGAIFGGIVIRGLLPKERLYQNERAVEFLGYIFLSPLFFLSIGASVSVTSLLIYPSMIVLIWAVSKGSKLSSSFLLFRKLLGNKYSLLLGLGLSVRFSTSLIVQFILLNSGFISLSLYSTLIATAILMKPVIIGVYSLGLSKGKPP